MQCPYCGSNRLPKDGHSRSKQTYRCGSCHYRFTPDGNRHYYSEHIKEQTIDLYGEGMAVAAISRVLAVNLGTVYAWIKKVRWALKVWAWVQRQRHEIVPAISFDEMWTYQQARHGETFLRLYERLPDAERYYSDEYGVYGSRLPACRRLAGKGRLANWNEGFHSEWRGRQKRLARATAGTRSGCGFCVVRWRCCVCVRGEARNPTPARAENAPSSRNPVVTSSATKMITKASP